MPSVAYGKTRIDYEIRLEKDLKHDYIQVEQGMPVLYRTSATEEREADKAVLKRARWIIQKLKLVAEPLQERLRTGSRLPYFGRRYYVDLRIGEENRMEFTGGKINIRIKTDNEDDLENITRDFYREKCEAKIRKRFAKWSDQTGLEARELIFRKVEKRWGSCSNDDRILINTEAAKLPWALIDYLIVHELCHLRHKDHTKAFWKMVEQYMPDYMERDRQLDFMAY
ncbi:hypothetical protein FUAX_53880 (plasmid) [Fulvitalea axinellae]|uniref:YgjP-like metallopeptidase domain-containing protein n=1 Tax=Fulvitalea axinellae TaxID=1182444 RepID=A0AAU9DIJ2_9BACT|nr:hypothetical protein FUAX_53880 [Fulvitalea axinellae]